MKIYTTFSLSPGTTEAFDNARAGPIVMHAQYVLYNLLHLRKLGSAKKGSDGGDVGTALESVAAVCITNESQQ